MAISYPSVSLPSYISMDKAQVAFLLGLGSNAVGIEACFEGQATQGAKAVIVVEYDGASTSPGRDPRPGFETFIPGHHGLSIGSHIIPGPRWMQRILRRK
jgi:hypothetical protein